ncbi:rac GTPase-activating protein 1-like isoform X2 [Zophobas morio]|uniref:rac GTPase-activating protein 1-like isoform X2 n=1 Tax=Zophobas morio TaxID=2755281 RepID=UPI003083DFEC
MCDTPFKTPLPYRTPKADFDRDFYPEKIHSDSEESVASSNSDNAGSGGTQSSNGEISLVAEFDDLVRFYRCFRSKKLETEFAFADFVEQVKQLYVNYYGAIDECRRLQSLLDAKVHECSDLDHKLLTARKLLDKEKHNTRVARREKDELASQINHVRNILFQDKASSGRLSAEEMRQKLSFLHYNNNNLQSEWDLSVKNPQNAHLSAIKEINSTGSILSDFSYSRSEDDLDSSSLQTGKAWKKHRPSTGGVAEPAVKKRRSSTNKAVEIGSTDTVRATTTLTVTKDGPITATSIIESVPKTPGPPESVTTNSETCTNGVPANLVLEAWARDSPLSSEHRLHSREHCFQQKTLVMPETCTPCEKRIRFAKTAYKCKECKAICHLECKDKLPLPCIPVVNTPNQRNMLGVIGDYTPTTPPMVPAILIHCINEIELRGLAEVGVYRIPGAERDVKALKERFLRGKGSPCLNQIDVHVICGTVKDFLRSLHEPLVTYGLWKKFVQAVETSDPIDVRPALYQVISELPQPNRDTLAYMMLHLQRISEAKECKMTVTNLAKVFGPTIVGYSSDNPSANALLEETTQQLVVMENLINIPSDYWSTFINIERSSQPSRLQQTPSTDSLLRPLASKGLFTPVGNTRSMAFKKRQRYFPSPKNMR